MTIQPAPSFAPGLRHSAHFIVDMRHTVPQVDTSWPGFQEMPPVLATAMMVAFMEQTCIQGLSSFLEPGQKTVGIHVDVSHVAATPVGMTVTADVELVAIDGKTLLFKVSCHDEAGLIGEGMHRRSIIDVARFMQRLQDKQATAIVPTRDFR
ncbi:MAG: thioesterase family protein [Comamonas sp.]|jgi:fluoroacetyl-CoA thioesterase|nr:thioesterase family protein [Comamonas sp.]